MNAGPTTTRRAFLLSSSVLGVTLAARWFAGWPPLQLGRRSVSERLTALVEHAPSARVVGLEYLEAVPVEARPATLASLVAERIPGGRLTIETHSDGRLRELLVQAAASDFEEGRTIVLRGWVLARTEARLYALAAHRVE